MLSRNDTSVFKDLNAFLNKHTSLNVLRHFTDSRLPHAPGLIDDAVGVFPDLEWFDNSNRPQVPQKITELGLATLKMSALRLQKSV